MIVVGTAGWSIPRRAAPAFRGDGFHLERYSRVLGCAEINSSFHRPHARSVYPIERIERWAEELRALPSSANAWCIFDNTASGAAIENALELQLEVSKDAKESKEARIWLRLQMMPSDSRSSRAGPVPCS